MKRVFKDFVAAFFMGLVLPTILVAAAVVLQRNRAQAAQIPETIPLERAIVRYSAYIRSGEQVKQGDLDDYLVGVVLAEMPTSFEMEALKAQAVAARTYARKAFETGGKHGDGSVCTQSTCCQSYIDPQAYLTQGGTEEGLQKVRSAVEGTSGQVLTFEGGLIEACYFSSSGGNTEAAVAVWGTEYPYLQSVPSPGEEDTAYFRDTVMLAPEAFAQALSLSSEEPVEDWFGLSSYTAGGSVQTMTIAGETFTGTQLRELLNLRSAAFTVAVVDGNIQITTKGFGHRVGMSQYGAQAMALQGNTYEQILLHYYPGTELTCLAH